MANLLFSLIINTLLHAEVILVIHPGNISGDRQFEFFGDNQIKMGALGYNLRSESQMFHTMSVRNKVKAQ